MKKPSPPDPETVAYLKYCGWKKARYTGDTDRSEFFHPDIPGFFSIEAAREEQIKRDTRDRENRQRIKETNMATATPGGRVSQPATTSTVDFEVLSIALDRIIPTPDNRRVFDGPDDKNAYLVQLAASIAAHGLRTPILVRPHPEKPGYYDLRAGECRWRASKLAGNLTILAIVREMDDKAAALETVIENKDRADLHPLEQADNIQMLLDHGFTIDEVATELNLSTKHILRRKQLTNLCKAWREHIAKHDPNGHTLGAAHLELVARYPESTQINMLKALVIDCSENECVTPHGIRDYMRSELHALSTAPWKLDDDTLLPSMGPCTTCTRRSDCQAELFDRDDFASQNNKKKAAPPEARCLDLGCWNGKQDAFLKRREAELKQQHGKVLLAGNSYDLPESSAYKRKPLVSRWNLNHCKAGDKGAIPVLDVTDDIGKVTWAKPPKEVAARSSSTATEAKTPSLAKRRAQLEKERAAMIQAIVVERIEEIIDGKRRTPDLFMESIDNALVFSQFCDELEPAYHKAKDGAESDWKKFQALRHRPLSEIIACAVKPMITSAMWDLIKPHNIADTCRYLELGDYTEIVEQVHRKKPEPKSWAKEEAKASASSKPAKTNNQAPGKGPKKGTAK